MHRSGTSAMTRALAFAGAALPRRVLGPDRDSNPTGHWEPSRIVAAHDRMLERIGSGWDDICPPAPGAGIGLNDAAVELAQLLEEEYGDARLFVAKDPRLARMMPAWRRALTMIGAVPRAVVMVRNPLEVAASLGRRDRMAEHRALYLWLREMLEAERASRDFPRMFVSYDRLVQDGPGTVAAIWSELRLGTPPRAEQSIEAFLTPDHRHHESSLAELMERTDIPDCVKRAFAWFSDTVAGRAPAPPPDILDEIGLALRRAEEALLAPSLIQACSESAQDRLLFLDAKIALLQAQLGKLAEVQDQLLRLKQSNSWRLTAPCRALAIKLRSIAARPGRQKYIKNRADIAEPLVS